MKKKLFVVVLALVLASTLFSAIGVTQAKTVTSKNLIASWIDGTIFDSMKLDGSNYPDDHGLKFGKVGNVFTLVNNDNEVHDVSGGGYFANAAMPLARELTATITSYTVSAKVTPVFKGNYGGAGIVFGMYNSKPMSFWVSEANTYIVSMDGNEYFGIYPGATNTNEKVPFSIDTAYTLKIVVKEGMVSFYYNDVLLEADIDFTEYEVIPAVGSAQNNYRATFENFSITVEDQALQLVDYKDAANLAMDGMGLYDVYSMENAAQQPFPQDWGIRVAKVNGAYTRTDNKMAPAINDNHGATYIGISKNVSQVENYMVSALVKPTKKNNWGGVGITIGKDTVNGYPIIMWVCIESAETDSPLGTITIGYNLNEWAKPVKANAFVPEIGSSFNLAAVVNGNTVFAYVDGEYAGEATIDIDFEPAVGVDFKNYQAEFTEMTFKTLDTDLDNATYNVSFISGGIELKKQEYSVGTAIKLEPIERDGFTFGGWKIFPDLSGETVNDVANNVAGDIFIYCEYIIKTYTIKYYDGSNEITDSGNDTTYDMRTFVDFKAITKDGYKFIGWYNNPQFTGDAITAIQTGSYGDLSLYAKFEPEGGTSGGNEVKKGCGSTLIMTSMGAVLGIISIAFALIIVIYRKRKED